MENIVIVLAFILGVVVGMGYLIYRMVKRFIMQITGTGKAVKVRAFKTRKA